MYPFYLFDLDIDATDEQVAERYHELIRRYPPDRSPEEFAVLRQAYEALRDHRSRVESWLFYYDSLGRSLEQLPITRQLPSERKRITTTELAGLARSFGEGPRCRGGEEQ